MKTRTRFAPSPTGYLHVGGIRTALFAWLLARQNKGQFILRLEDTDQAREVEGSGKHIAESLRWLGLDWDEGIEIGGEYGPYTQSERLDIYKKYADKLVSEGKAYADPYTAKQVNEFRDLAKKDKKPFLYRNHRPENPPKWDGTMPLRFKSDPKSYHWNDAVMGDLSAGPEAIDDFILIKSDGFPTYNFAHIIDDLEMKCTHVIRSQEFLASVPKYLNLYEAMDIEKPILATVPYVMGPDGNKKLSKRDGAKDVLDYARDGITPEALVNFMASLGWNDGTEKEKFTIDELIEKFSLDRVQKGGARFDEKRLIWLNGLFIREMPLDKLVDLAKDFLPESSKKFKEPYIKQVVGLSQERLKFFKELPELTEFFFHEPSQKSVLNLLHDPKNKQLRKLSDEEIKSFLEKTHQELQDSDFSKADIETRLNNLLEQLQTKPGILFSIIRISISGSPASPQLFDTLSVIGKTKTLDRIQKTIDSL